MNITKSSNDETAILVKFLFSKKFSITCEIFPNLYRVFLSIPKNISSFPRSNKDDYKSFNSDGLIESHRKVMYTKPEIIHVRKENGKIYKSTDKLYDLSDTGNKFCRGKYYQKPTIALSLGALNYNSSPADFDPLDDSNKLTAKRLSQTSSLKFSNLETNLSLNTIQFKYHNGKSQMQSLLIHMLREADIDAQSMGNYIYIPAERTSSNLDENN